MSGLSQKEREKVSATEAERRTTAAELITPARIPGIANIFQFYRTSLFCRNLAMLLGSGVNLTSTLRILIDIMAVTGSVDVWTAAADRVRQIDLPLGELGQPRLQRRALGATGRVVQHGLVDGSRYPGRSVHAPSCHGAEATRRAKPS